MITAAIPMGMLTRKIQRHESQVVSTPPASGPIATAAPIVAPQIPNAVPRSLPWNSCEISASAVANMIAPPIPWIPRATIKKSESFERPQAAEAIVNSTTPITKRRLRPNRSASDPAVRTQVARPSAYASTTHWRSENEAWSARSIAGSATFTIVMSSSSMNVAVQTVRSVQPLLPIPATYT